MTSLRDVIAAIQVAQPRLAPSPLQPQPVSQWDEEVALPSDPVAKEIPPHSPLVEAPENQVAGSSSPNPSVPCTAQPESLPQVNPVPQQPTTTQDAQEQMLKEFLSGGWGKLAHTVTRQLKAPGRHSLKLVDVALIVTVYDQTIAQVNPRMFAAITNGDFTTETGMDHSNLRAGLRGLVSRGILLKVTRGQTNLWALNPLYFKSQPGCEGLRPEKKRGATVGQITPPSVGQITPPSMGQITPPSVGQITPPLVDSNNWNHSGKFSAKNLSENPRKESKKESLSCETFFPYEAYPPDLQERWRHFAQEGKTGHVKHERKIFQELLAKHGGAFAQHCGPVLQFLESQGKEASAGESEKIHSPFAYLQNHWEQNLSRYRDWQKQQQELQANRARKAELERQGQERESREQQQRQQAEQQAFAKEQVVALILGELHTRFPEQAELERFVDGLIGEETSEMIYNSWKKFRWKSGMVQAHVVDLLSHRRAELWPQATEAQA